MTQITADYITTHPSQFPRITERFEVGESRLVAVNPFAPAPLLLWYRETRNSEPFYVKREANFPSFSVRVLADNPPVNYFGNNLWNTDRFVIVNDDPVQLSLF